MGHAEKKDEQLAASQAKAWWKRTGEDDHSVDSQTRDVVVLVLGQVLNFLDYHEGGRHQAKSKLYMRMVFTERSTYAVRSQLDFEECEPFVRHERDTFRAAEIPFLDTFVADSTPDLWSIRRLWEIVFKERRQGSIDHLVDRINRFEHGEKGLTPPSVSWIDIRDYQDYLKSQYGIEATDSVIS